MLVFLNALGSDIVKAVPKYGVNRHDSKTHIKHRRVGPSSGREC